VSQGSAREPIIRCGSGGTSNENTIDDCDESCARRLRQRARQPGHTYRHGRKKRAEKLEEMVSAVHRLRMAPRRCSTGLQQAAAAEAERWLDDAAAQLEMSHHRYGVKRDVRGLNLSQHRQRISMITRYSGGQITQAAACAFRFLRQASRPKAPRPVANNLKK